LSQKYKSFVAAVDNVEIPRNIQEALQRPKWAAAVTEEVQALVKNGTLVTTVLKGKTSVGCKWIFTIKCNVVGNINRNKARLVAKGFTQSYGVDYSHLLLNSICLGPIISNSKSRLASTPTRHKECFSKWGVRKGGIYANTSRT